MELREGLGASGCLRMWSSAGWELESPGVALNLKQSEEAFGLWSERRAGDVMGRAEDYLQKHAASGTQRRATDQGGGNRRIRLPGQC